MMKRWISMLLALLLMLGMATAENSADDAWEYELVGRAIAADGCAGTRAAV